MIVDVNNISTTEAQATHAVALDLTKLTAARSELKREVRNYEVSLWTLQDEFITVLKWSNAEQAGRIQDPEMELNVDGTQTLYFKIPMYLEHFTSDGRTVIENPIWYNTKNGNMMEGMRKVKVIFNKMTDEQEIFEFIIVKVTEEHQDDQLFCSVECEGLAFHELGKIGYKINLSSDNFAAQYEEYINNNRTWTRADGTKSSIEPRETIDYWCEESGLVAWPGDAAVLDPKVWYYRVQLNWDSFNDIKNGNNNIIRQSNKMYEEGYITAWDDNTLVPLAAENAREKERAVTISESNLYNITQTIAEQFNVFCKYEYRHDENNHIISRTVVFYNNYLAEENGTISLTYPYSSTAIKREIDSTELTTKMYVRSEDDSTILSGQISIMDAPANKTKEDYILNFDYMYKCGAITQDQYDSIQAYELQMRQINSSLETIAAQISYSENSLIDLRAEKSILEESIKIAEEQINNYSDLYKHIESQGPNPGDGYFERTADTNYSTLAIYSNKEQRYYINFGDEDKGIKEDSIFVYKTYNPAAENNKLSDLIGGNQQQEYSYKKDKYGDIIRVYFGDANTFGDNESKKVYVVYKYSPKFYYDQIIRDWSDKLTQDRNDLQNIDTRILFLDISLNSIKLLYDNKRKEKYAATHAFEILMGGALREGFWQPEEYQDYGITKNMQGQFPTTFNLTAMTESGQEVVINWDSQLFKEEEKIYYESGVMLSKQFYPCIDISGNLVDIRNALNNTNGNLSFIFNNNYYKNLDSAEERNKLENITVFSLGGKMELGFIRVNKTNEAQIKPVLILTGAKDMTDEEIKFMLVDGQPKVCCFATTTANNSLNISLTNAFSVGLSQIYWETDKWTQTERNNITNFNMTSIKEATRIYPRIRFCNPALRITGDDLSIAYESSNSKLMRYEDYSAVTRTTLCTDNTAQLEYFITIKPEVLFRSASGYTGTVYVTYRLSNAATSIFLDAQKILKENSEPKVSYEIEVNAFNKDYIKYLYSMLTQLVVINDTDLKLYETYGYISQVSLKLDAPWDDTIEVKNYTSKFEDLFSTIVAQTDEMKKREGAYNAVLEGKVPINSDALEKMLSNTQIQNMLNAYIDSQFDSSEVVQRKLAALFSEASQILGNAKRSINSVQELSRENATILGSFVQNIQAELTSQVFTSRTQPTDFKVGDIWNKIDEYGAIIGRFVATADSSSAPNGGWTQTYDGTLAQIKGAGVDYNAATGIVDIYGEHQINLRSGKNIYIAADDSVDIVGNNSVNIGGGTINIAADRRNQNDLFSGSINLVASYNNNFPINFTKDSLETSVERIIENNTINDGTLTKVLISPEKIEMTSADIYMKGANKLLFVASDGNEDGSGTSAVQISVKEGIWIGSGKGIRLYSGGAFTYNNSNKTITTNDSANVELNNDHLILGYASNENTQAIEMKKNYLIIASGSTFNIQNWEAGKGYAVNNIVYYNNTRYKCKQAHTSTSQFQSENWELDPFTITGTSDGLVGVMLTKNSIGFATESNNKINAILMNDQGITIGSGVNVTLPTITNNNDPSLRSSTSGSYVRVAAEGIELGSLADLYINTNNFKFQTNSTKDNNGTLISKETIFAIGNDLQSIDQNTTVGYDGNGEIHFYNNGTQIQNNGVEPSVNFLVNKSGAYIKGTVYADAGKFTGTVVATSFTTSGNDASLTYLKQLQDGTITKDIVTANTNITNIANGTTSIRSFNANGNTLILFNQLSKTSGLTIAGVTSDNQNNTIVNVFRASSTKMGFFTLPSSAFSSVFTNTDGEWNYNEGVFDTNAVANLWYEDGNLYLTGTLEAARVNVLENGITDSFANYISTKANVTATLTDVFNNAGKILSAASTLLTDVYEDTVASGSILSSFKENIEKNLTPTTYVDDPNNNDQRSTKTTNNNTTTYSPAPYFKIGDIWTRTDGSQYTATCNWNELYWKYKNDDSSTNKKIGSNTNDNTKLAASNLTSLNGWTKTSYGRFAGITGAKLNVDAESGLIELVSNDISIVGQHTIALSGPSMTLTSSYTKNEAEAISAQGKPFIGGIKMIATVSGYTGNDKDLNGISYINMNGSGIEITAKGGIVIKSGRGIDICFSTGTNAGTSAIRMNETEGVWIGSGKAVQLYSGPGKDSGSVSGTNFLMTPERFRFGAVSEQSNAASAIDMSPTQILIAAGSLAGRDNSCLDPITQANTLAGLQIQRNYFGIATGDGSSTHEYRSLIEMTPTRILIGVAKKVNADVNSTNFITNLNEGKISGGYILIAQETVSSKTVPLFEIGSTGIFRVLTPTFTINNAASVNDKMLYLANNSDWNYASNGIQFTNNTLDIKTSGTLSMNAFEGKLQFGNRAFKFDTRNHALQAIQSDTIGSYKVNDIIEIDNDSSSPGNRNGLYIITEQKDLKKVVKYQAYTDAVANGTLEAKIDELLEDSVKFKITEDGELICKSIRCESLEFSGVIQKNDQIISGGDEVPQSTSPTVLFSSSSGQTVNIALDQTQKIYITY